MAKQIMSVISLAWRNIWRNTRRTIITVVAVVFAVTLAVFSWCFALGEHEQMINDALKLFTGHLQVHAKGYWEDRTIYNSFTPPPELLSFLDKDKKVKAYTTRLSVDALISSDANTSGVLVVGIDPGREFSSMKEKIKSGSFLESGDKTGILIGETLARNLNIGLGDELSIITQAYDGSMGAGLFTVRGIFRTGSADVDRSMAFINLPAAQYLLSMDGLVTELTIFLDDARDVSRQQKEIASILDPKQYEVMAWQKLIPDLVQFVELDNMFGYIYYFLILIVVIFGILNTILMSVMERYREFGVMMALGTRPSKIVRLIMVESTLIALVGIVIGNIIGFLISYHYTQVPMDFSSYSQSLETFGLNPLIYAKIYPWVFWVTDLIILGSTLLSAIYPAVKASRLSPVRALRYV